MICTIIKMNSENDGLNTKFLIFDGKNSNRWLIQMHVLFGAQHVLDLINDGYTLVVENATKVRINMQCEKKKKDHKALFYIHQCVDTNVFEKLLIQRRQKRHDIH